MRHVLSLTGDNAYRVAGALLYFVSVFIFGRLTRHLVYIPLRAFLVPGSYIKKKEKKIQKNRKGVVR